MQDSKFKILHLSKQHLKFSSAHFLIFNEMEAERLHGHNYQVAVDFKFREAQMGEKGYGVGFGELKALIKASVDQWDEFLLLPSKNPYLQIEDQGSAWGVRFGEKDYRFPKTDTRLLPLLNTSVEGLSTLLAENLWHQVRDFGLLGIRVEVQETAGQSAFSHEGEWF